MFLELVHVVEEQPGRALVEDGADIVGLGVFLAVEIGGVGGPHLRLVGVLVVIELENVA